MKFLVPNYSCLQNPWLGGLPPPHPRFLCPQLNLLNSPEQNFWVRHWMEVAKDAESSNWRLKLKLQTQSEHYLVKQCRLGAKLTQLFYYSELVIWFRKDKRLTFASTKRILRWNWWHFSGLGILSYWISKWHWGTRCDSSAGALERVY